MWPRKGQGLGFSVTVVPPLAAGAGIVSSTEIRGALQNGDITAANDLLGHPYLVRGTVVEGLGMGRDLGFPTANVRIDDPMKLWPPQGVYAVRVGWLGQKLPGMMNIGTAPTVKDGEPTIEVHLFDFDHSIYGDTVSIYCESFLREERRSGRSTPSSTSSPRTARRPGPRSKLLHKAEFTAS